MNILKNFVFWVLAFVVGVLFFGGFIAGTYGLGVILDNLIHTQWAWDPVERFGYGLGVLVGSGFVTVIGGALIGAVLEARR